MSAVPAAASASSPAPAPAPDDAPIGIDSFFQPRRAAFWLLWFYLIDGAFSVFLLARTSYQAVPQGMLLSLVVWTLYALPVVWVLRRVDLGAPADGGMLTLAFAWGGLGAVYLAIPCNDAIMSLASRLGSPAFRDSWAAAIAGPTTEELLKYVGLVLLVLVARTRFLTPLSVVMAGAMTGLGFQVVEDFVYSVNASASAASDDPLSPVFDMVLVRGLLCGLWSHAVYTSVTSYGLALYLFRRDRSRLQRIGMAAGFYALGWLLHAAWNSPLLEGLALKGPAGVLALVILKGVPVLAVGVWVWRMALRDQTSYLTALAQTFVQDPDLISADEQPQLASLASRHAALKVMGRAHGRKARRALARLHRAQLSLLLAWGRWGPGPKVQARAARIRRARARLAQTCS